MRLFALSAIIIFSLTMLFQVHVSSASPHPIFTGFAEPTEFTISKDTITFPDEQSADSITLTITDDAIYRYVQTSFDGQNWIQRTIQNSTQCTFHPDDPSHTWLTGTCTLTVSLSASGFPSLSPGTTATRNYITAYSCGEILFPILGFRLGWDCHGSTGTPQMWQIWRFDASLEAQEPPSSWQEGLLAWWKLDGNARDSAGDNDGTVSGDVATGTDCLYGGCYEFDGNNDKIDVGVIPIPGNKGSMALWLKAEATDDWRCAIGRHWTQHSIGKWGDSIYFTGSWETEGESWGGIESDVEVDNEWHHIVLTYDGDLGSDNLKIYVDGEFSNSKNLIGNNDHNDEPWQIGTHGDDRQFWLGSIDEVMLFDRALSSAEVADMYAFFTVTTCVDDGDCPHYQGSAYCFDGDVYSDDHDWSCIGGVCVDSVSSVLVKDCQDGYTCFSRECREGTGDIFNIFYNQDFEDRGTGEYTTEEIKADWNNARWGYPIAPGSLMIEEENGNRFMRNYLFAGTFSLGEGSGIDWYMDIPYAQEGYGLQDEIYLSFKVKFSENMGSEYETWPDGSTKHYLAGKIHGIYTTHGTWPAGSKPGPDEGFYELGMFTSETPSDPDKLQMNYYTYYQEMSCNSCDARCSHCAAECLASQYTDECTIDVCNYCEGGAEYIPCSVCPDEYKKYWGNYAPVDYLFEPERWYTVTRRVVLNSPWTSDGIVEFFVDGELVESYRGYRFRDTVSVMIEEITISSFLGGSGYPPHEDAWWAFDDFAVFNYKEGAGVAMGLVQNDPGTVIPLPFDV